MARIAHAPRSRSQKAAIIEALFDERWDPTTQELSDPVVTVDDIRRHGFGGNVWDFFKSFVRRTASANANWPPSVLARGFTAVQDVSRKGNCFRFERLPPGQTAAFLPLVPLEGHPTYQVESASIPLASRQLGRNEETWLVQVAVRLRVIETHLTLFSPRNIVNVDHLQMSAKLGGAEIDALFLAVEECEGSSERRRELIVTCEAKGPHDDIIEEQICRQVSTISRQRAVSQEFILPLAVKVIGRSRLLVGEFDVVPRAQAATLQSLSLVSAAIYELVPPVPGIGS